ncbi:jg4814 [Pararge aegeria aegeria]|uniref:Jg4814 protein n=1 Tax=Pararge aegeria aegeria TaxID=348720 RepID=A0A8S4S7V7_9NEOP|nr:jg4814 [Pararge aegeria aegeria]
MSIGFSLILFLCAVIGINCWSGDNCAGCRGSEYTRNKRAKYYSVPSYKYYNRPTYSHNRGPFYTSSHSYTQNDIGPATRQRPYKVSKRPTHEGLGDEDFNNLMKYLSNKDLDKIVEFAADKEIYTDKYRDLNDYEYNGDLKNTDYEEDLRPYSQFEYNKYSSFENRNPNINMNYLYSQVPINTEESGETEQLSVLDEYIQKEINVMSDRNNIFTDSDTMREEQLPKPLNLREDDYVVSFTNNVPSFVKPETEYRLENFADLPLMEYENSKLEKVNSYSVPHYSVISSSNSLPRSPSPTLASPSLLPSILSLKNVPEVEPAPPASTAKEQSDAHLKAIKIWTHKSKGTAYTLHDDGTLSLENPTRPRYKFP